MEYEKIEPLSLFLTDYVLLTEIPSRMNFTGVQSGLDGVPVSEIWIAQAKERGGKRLLTSETIQLTEDEQILSI